MPALNIPDKCFDFSLTTGVQTAACLTDIHYKVDLIVFLTLILLANTRFYFNKLFLFFGALISN